jgi:coproporphyrinogen III oxidase
MIAENNSAMVWWWSRFNAIICLKKMQDTFIKRKTACDKHNPEFYPKYKNNVMPISGTHIAMKHVELEVCSLIIAKRQTK